MNKTNDIAWLKSQMRWHERQASEYRLRLNTPNISRVLRKKERLPPQQTWIPL